MPPNTASRSSNTTQHHTTQPSVTHTYVCSSADNPELPALASDHTGDLDVDCSGSEHNISPQYPFPILTDESARITLHRLELFSDTSTEPTSTSSRHLSTSSKSQSAPFDCRWPGCYKQFGRRPNRDRHEQDFHLDAKPYQCHAHAPGLERSYKEKKALIDHLQKKHGVGRKNGHDMVSMSPCITGSNLQAGSM